VSGAQGATGLLDALMAMMVKQRDDEGKPIVIST
jgi:hypothetical protein